jgi:hypothetical protein
MKEFWINMGVTALFVSIKSADGKAKLKKICLKVYNTIKAVYAGDPDFA